MPTHVRRRWDDAAGHPRSWLDALHRIFNGIRNMPAYRDQLTLEELDAIVYFLLALPETTVVSHEASSGA